jgi:class 3 adenylate cyclase
VDHTALVGPAGSRARTDVAPRRSAVRGVVWTLHLVLPLAVLWLLLARPRLDVRWEHDLWHLVLVGGSALASVLVGLRIAADARLRLDGRLQLVALAFLTAAAFLGLHALATPAVLLPGPNAGFALATPVGLVAGGALAVAAGADWDRRGAALVARGRLLAGLLLCAVVGWGAASLLRLPPLRTPIAPDVLAGPLRAVAVLGAALYLVAAVQLWRLHRRRRGAVLLSLLTAWTLLAESMVAVALGPSWQLSWWLWHVTVLLAFGFVAYAGWVQLRLDGRAAGLFDVAGTEATAADVAAAQRSALTRLVDALEAAPAAAGDSTDVGATAAAVGAAHGLGDGQIAVLERAGTALAAERLQQRRLAALAAVGAAASIGSAEPALLHVAGERLAEAFAGHDPRLLLGPPPPDAGPVGGARSALHARGHTIGWLELAPGPHGVGPTEQAVLDAFAGQIGLAIENVRTHRELDGLFRTYLSPAVAAALIADPAGAHLGGAIAEVSVLFADLTGFTAFSEAHAPTEVVAMLNTHYAAAVPAILGQGGTVVQFVGDEVMALFGTPVHQPDHALRAARAGLALQRATTAVADAHPTWPRFRVGINTGPALVGNVGAEQMRGFTAIGDTTNTAARIQSAAEPGTVYLGLATATAIGDAAVTTVVGPVSAKGKAEPLHVVRLEEVR